MQVGNPFPRYTFACIAPNKKRIHATPFHLAVATFIVAAPRFGALESRIRKPDDISGATRLNQDRTAKGAFQSKGFLFATGLGAASASLYYVLVNGPSRSAATSSTAPLSPTHFTPVTLTASVPCTPYTKVLTLTLPSHLIPDANIRAWSIFSIYVKDSDIQVERPYTPLEGIDANGQMHFWVKRYQGGEVGRWLHERKIGDEIEVRGPIPTWKWPDEEWDEIVMISGGTGITPFYQLIHSIFSRADGKLPRTRLKLLHSSPTPLDLPPESILGPLQTFAELYPESFSLRLFADSADPKASRQSIKLDTGRIDRRRVEDAIGSGFQGFSSWWTRLWPSPPRLDVAKILFLVCGPEPMVAAIAGPRARNLTQGNVGGILGDMGVKPHQVCKL
ncbi:hypothetical protein K439DRAFT_1323633 [Ramaria rubella]|nr:hypothetical protein K439DRAFT_1323633 [Ramaria rubella]